MNGEFPDIGGRLRGKISQGIVASLAFHLAIVIALIVAPLSGGKRLFLGPVYSVDLVSGLPAPAPRPAPAAEKSAPAPAKAQPPAKAKKPARTAKKSPPAAREKKERVREKKQRADVILPAEKKKKAALAAKAKAEAEAKAAAEAKAKAEAEAKAAAEAKVKAKAEAEAQARKRQKESKLAQEKVNRAISNLRLQQAIKDLQAKVALENLRRRLQESSSSHSATDGKGSSSRKSVTPGPARGGLSRQILDIKFKYYYNQLMEKIQDAWVAPQGLAQSKKPLEVILSVQIKKDGSVGKVWIEDSSGNTFFDDTARRAVINAQPFPPPPEVDKDGQFEVGIRFHDPRNSPNTIP